MRRKLTLWALFCLVLALLPSQTASVAVMSVDLGSEWMKVAIVKPGVPMEIALNKESRRKTPIAVCLKENERLFGDSALGVSVKNPKFVYRHLQSLLGKKHDNPQVAVYQKRFPEHHLGKDESRGTVLFSNSEEMQYSPEELLGMVLNYSRGLAQDFAEQPIKDAVITVPAFFNQAERRAVLQAAQMAGVKVLQLINDNTAVALNYGVFRRKDINSTAQNIMFYDMGSGSTTATIVTYQTVKTKESGTQPQLQIRGVGFDRSLGGFEMELRLQDHLAKLFNKQKKTKKDVRENHRAMAKLLKEAQRLKTVLSANAEFMAQVEGLLDDMDFKAKVTRVEFEALCADLFERVPGPVQEALSSAEMTLDEIEQVILVGGSTRVPKVQEVLLKAVGKEELGKNINADEAAAMGAVYQAAALSKAFKVKPFLVREAAIFPIQVEFTREMEEEDGSRSLKHNKRILFQRMAPYPQRKVITFNRYTDDFAFYINYGDLSFLGQEDLSVFGSLNLTTVQLSGVGSSFKKHTDAESKGIKAHFNMDESGVLLLDRVESVFETVVEEKEEESTLTKLGNTISSLFGGATSEPNANVTEAVQDEEEVHPEAGKEQEEQGQKEEAAPQEEKEEAAPQEEKQEPGEKQQEEAAPTQENTEGVDSKADPQDEKEGAKSGEEEKTTEEAAEEAAKTEAEEKAKPQKKTKISEDVAVELQVNDILNPSLEAITSSNKKLQDLTDRDLEKQEREKTLNSLEAFIFETQDKMYQEEYQAVVSEEEKEAITAKLSEASAWMDEDGYTAATKELREKLQELRKLCKAMFFRVEERRKLPDHLAALESMLNHSSFFLRSAKLIPEDDQIFTDVELKTLEKVINETTTWKNTTVAEQEKRSPTERPLLLSKDIESKLSLLDREVNYLLNKAKFAKPKAKPKAKNNSTTSESSSKANSSNTEEKVILPKEETKDEEGTEEVQPEEPPIKEPIGHNTDSPSQSQPTDKTASAEGTEEVQPEEPPIKEPIGHNTDSPSQSQPTDKTASAEPTEKNQSENHIGDEL
ncbi:hypoxia up-regulated protein 1 isoform X1 [Coregonus clupeaformis]|uniref:hypoxia up-regulated protein 1 isoform X1 n=1 Tax=Coregonus clupeaformis TaxID=59861 RepID=UPI001BDFDD22|nr:hypoxia up-regulated protein 1 isoform X1 [Coregonus clupeaformis]XP_041742314.1 hypoxia up-regulated protein 1 isoform X1 [Coregonus clupeaformis]XP_041742315.1 hypoxia up-regulated protein 1 isoform X1 [Coregonus clupeaformis]XP_041742317.1 hypoxia up-regulated protein 1 isoform X1 [Coregonus clupeaformis]